jgi:hypothetical protein
MRLAAEMIGQLDLKRSLDQTQGQLREHPAGPSDLLLALGAGQELSDDGVRQPALQII